MSNFVLNKSHKNLNLCFDRLCNMGNCYLVTVNKFTSLIIQLLFHYLKSMKPTKNENHIQIQRFKMLC